MVENNVLLIQNNKGITLLGVLIKISLFFSPILIFFLYILRPDTNLKNFFTIFIILVIFERIFEAFYLKKIKRNEKIKRDGMLELITLSYIILILIMTFEFYFFNRNINILFCMVYLFVFFIAFLIRWWGIQTLSNQWNIFINKENIRDSTRTLIKEGPYKYIRHPIYLGFILEILTLPLIINSFYGLLFSSFFFIPLIIIRSLREEKELIHIFGDKYKSYRKNTVAFLPFLKFWRLRNE